MKHKPIVMYDICDVSEGLDPYPSLGEHYHSREEALRELKKVRLDYPKAYLAKIVHAPCREKVAKKGR